MKKSAKQAEVKFPLGVKLALIIGSIVVISLGAVTFLNSYFVSKDVRITAEDNNLTINTRSATTVQNELASVRANVLQLLDLITVVNGGRNSALARQAEAFFFERNQNMAAVLITSSVNDYTQVDIRLENTRFFSSNELDPSVSDEFLNANAEAIFRSCNGETIALNASPYFNLGVMALLLPYRENGLEQCCVILFSLESIADVLGTGGTNTTFMINDNDDLLCYPDSEKILSGQSMKTHALVVEMRQSNQNNEDSRQIPYTSKDE